VTDHKTKQQRALAEVQADVETRLRSEGARKAAMGAAQAAAAKVASGEALSVAVGAGVQVMPKQSVGRAGNDAIASEIVKAAFKVARPEPGKVSVGTAAMSNGDAAVFEVSAVRSGDSAAPPEQLAVLRAQTAQRAAQQAAAAEFTAYTNELERTAKVKKNPAVFAE
jgi:peptidyl-prolyl cis-trans isomerase D